MQRRDAVQSIATAGHQERNLGLGGRMLYLEIKQRHPLDGPKEKLFPEKIKINKKFKNRGFGKGRSGAVVPSLLFGCHLTCLFPARELPAEK